MYTAIVFESWRTFDWMFIFHLRKRMPFDILFICVIHFLTVPFGRVCVLQISAPVQAVFLLLQGYYLRLPFRAFRLIQAGPEDIHCILFRYLAYRSTSDFLKKRRSFTWESDRSFYALILSISVRFTPDDVRIAFRSTYLSYIALYTSESFSAKSMNRCILENSSTDIFIISLSVIWTPSLPYNLSYTRLLPFSRWKLRLHLWRSRFALRYRPSMHYYIPSIQWTPLKNQNVLLFQAGYWNFLTEIIQKYST